MKARTLFLLIALALIAVFAALNWSAFREPTTLSLVFGAVQAPLGLIMLGLTAFLAALFMLFAVFIQTSALFEARRHERELQAMRDLAEHAEASRFSKLQDFLEIETQKLADMDKESRAETAMKLDRLESALNSKIDQSENSIAAYIGELDDRLKRGAPDPSP
jgi:uncharacterized integral membrane protein